MWWICCCCGWWWWWWCRRLAGLTGSSHGCWPWLNKWCGCCMWKMLLLIRGGAVGGCPVNFVGSKMFSTLNFRDLWCCCCWPWSVRTAAAVGVTLGSSGAAVAASGGDILLADVMTTYGLSPIGSMSCIFLNDVSTTGLNRLRSTGRVASIRDRLKFCCCATLNGDGEITHQWIELKWRTSSGCLLTKYDRDGDREREKPPRTVAGAIRARQGERERGVDEGHKMRRGLAALGIWTVQWLLPLCSILLAGFPSTTLIAYNYSTAADDGTLTPGRAGRYCCWCRQMGLGGCRCIISAAAYRKRSSHLFLLSSWKSNEWGGRCWVALTEGRRKSFKAAARRSGGITGENNLRESRPIAFLCAAVISFSIILLLGLCCCPFYNQELAFVLNLLSWTSWNNSTCWPASTAGPVFFFRIR